MSMARVFQKNKTDNYVENDFYEEEKQVDVNAAFDLGQLCLIGNC